MDGKLFQSDGALNKFSFFFLKKKNTFMDTCGARQGFIDRTKRHLTAMDALIAFVISGLGFAHKT